MTKKPVKLLKDFANERAFHVLLDTYFKNISEYLKEEEPSTNAATKIKGNVAELLEKHAKENNGCAEVLKKTMNALLTTPSFYTSLLVMKCTGLIGATETKFSEDDKKYFSKQFNQSFQNMYSGNYAERTEAIVYLIQCCINDTNPSTLKKPIKTILENADEDNILMIFPSLASKAITTGNRKMGDLAVKVADALFDVIAKNEISESPNHDANYKTIDSIVSLMREGSFNDQDALDALHYKHETIDSALLEIKKLENQPLMTPDELIGNLDF